MDYQLTRDREQHLACELFGYREDSNKVAFAVAAVKKIYAHESLTFNNTVACEVIYKWKARLKDDMDARSDVYVLSNGYRKCSDDNDGYYWEYTTVGSQEYQVVCTRPGIASADVDMSDGFDRGLQTNVQVFVDFDYAMGRSITVMSRSITGYELMIWDKKEIWLKRLLTESGYELRLVAGIATGALVKGCFWFEVPAQVKVDAYRAKNPRIPESPWGSPIPIGDGDVNRFPDGDGDGDGDEVEKRGWVW
ncbi:hypothetical protein Tco_0174184 [Tanacetum coccineum]